MQRQNKLVKISKFFERKEKSSLKALLDQEISLLKLRQENT